MSQLSVSLFDEKASELDKLKKQAVIYMKKVNALKLEYMVSAQTSGELKGKAIMARFVRKGN